jgi:hypothetical protein
MSKLELLKKQVLELESGEKAEFFRWVEKNSPDVSQADLLEAQKRLEEHKNNPETAISWDEVQRQLRTAR